MLRSKASTRLVMVCALALAAMVTDAMAGEPRRVFGMISWVSDDAVEVDSHRALIGPDSIVMSDGREISLASVHTGMAAEAEIDDSGRLIELYVNGVVE